MFFTRAGGGNKSQQGSRQFSTPKPFLSPIGGWVSAQNLAAARPNTCLRLENWFPTTTGIRLRSGCLKKATIGTDPVESLMAYIGGNTRELFAADETNIFNITTVADPDVPPVADVTGQTSGYYSFLNFATVGGNFMTVVNGTDDMLSYDGATWTPLNTLSTPAITGVDTSLLSHVWAYRNRQWFIEAGSMNVWALPVDSIGGAMIQVSLAGVFQLGGSLLTGGTWSMDAGDGLDDKLVIISTEGEVAIYQGSDPSDPADFSLVGRYVIPPPMGKRCMMSAGGDLIIGTEGGMVPISAAVTKDPAALSIAAVSRNIEPDWLDDAQERRTLPWEIIKWDSRKTIYITTPVTSTEDITPAQCYVINAETGAFAKNTGWNTRCGVMHDDFMYFGTNAGTIMQADVGGSDDGELIYHTYVGSWDHMGAISAFKETKLARAIFLTRAEFTPKVSISTDYTISLPVPPSAASPSGSPGEWDVGVWDLSLWDTGLSTYTVTTKWVAVQKSGYVLAPQVQVVSGSTIAPNAELVMFDLTCETGNVVV
jgi:hypothetical protein